MIATLQRGGVVGIVGVVLMVGAVILSVYVDEKNQLHISPYGVIMLPGYHTALEDLPDRAATTLDRFLPFWGLIVAPLCFLFTFECLTEWLRRDDQPLARWLHSVGLLSLGFWIMSGVIRVTIIPHVEFTPLLFWLQLSSGLYEGAYLLMAFHALILAAILRTYKLLGPVMMNIGAAILILAALLFSPYPSANPLNLIAYIIPIVRMFFMSTLLLLQAERFARLEQA